MSLSSLADCRGCLGSICSQRFQHLPSLLWRQAAHALLICETLELPIKRKVMIRLADTLLVRRVISNFQSALCLATGSTKFRQ